MERNQLRPYAAVVMMLVLVLMLTTGLITYFAPQGPGSRLWEFMGLTKHEYKEIHFALALVLVVSASIHAYLNLKPLIRHVTGRATIWHHPMLIAVALVLVVIGTALALS